jgi:hypothetical protein
MSVGTLYYKLNNWVTFAFEQSLYETNAVPGLAGTLSLSNGIHSRTWCDLRSEGGTIFTFQNLGRSRRPRRGSFKRLTRRRRGSIIGSGNLLSSLK